MLQLQSLEAALKTVPKDRNGKLSKEYLRVALDAVGPSAGLPPYGALEEVFVLLMNFTSLRSNEHILHYFMQHAMNL